MKAGVLETESEMLGIADVPVPAAGPGVVLVRVEACGVCHTDLHVITGELGFPRPCVLGHEVAGVVEAVEDGIACLQPRITKGRGPTAYRDLEARAIVGRAIIDIHPETW